MAKMRAMVLEKLGPIEDKPLHLKEIDRHEITRPDQVLLKIEACGVCHSQLHSIEGDWERLGIPPVLPTVPGHEVVGRVVEAGADVTDLAVGDRAGITPLLESCLQCEYCKGGKEYLCDSAEITGESLRGGYAEYITVSQKFATKIPDSMSSQYAAPLFCAGITAYKAVRAAEPRPKKKIGIFGIGGVGHMAVQFARLEQCDIVAISRNKKHLEVAGRLGAGQTITYDDAKGLEGRLDAAIVFAPSDDVTMTAIRSIKKGGIVVMATVGPIAEFPTFEEKTVRGTLIGSRQDMRTVIELADRNDLQVVYKEYPLEQANEALAELKRSEIDARAVLVP